MRTTISTLIKAKQLAQDPKEVLMYLLEEEGDSLGWDRSALIGSAAMMIEGMPEETLEIAEGGLRGLLRDGLVITEGQLVLLHH